MGEPLRVPRDLDYSEVVSEGIGTRGDMQGMTALR